MRVFEIQFLLRQNYLKNSLNIHKKHFKFDEKFYLLKKFNVKNKAKTTTINNQ